MKRAITIGLVLAIVCPAQDEASFEKDLKKVRVQSGRGNWKAAHKKLSALLVTHANAAYVMDRRSELLEEIKRCAFYGKNPAPPYQSLISGKIVKYDKRTGAIKLRYTRKTLHDFKRMGRNKDILAHPAVFSGQHTITLKGNSYPFGDTLHIMACDSSEGAFSVVFGNPQDGDTYYPMSINHLKGDRRVKLASKQISPVRTGKKFVCKVKVGTSTIQAYYGKGLALKAKRPKAADGSVLIFDFPFTEIMLEGKVEPAWLQGLVDKELELKLKKFEKTYSPKQFAPSWLLAAPTEVAASESDNRIYPGKVRRRSLPFLNKAMGMFNTGKYVELIEKLKASEDRDAPKAARAMLMSYAYLELGKTEEALKHCDVALELDPEFWRLIALRANILTKTSRWDEAFACLQEGIDENPQAGLYENLLVKLLIHGDVTRADEVFADAKKVGVSSVQLTKLATTLRIARRGPSWPRKFEHKSTHYHIVSDIDKKTCVDAAKVLEQAFVTYQSHLGWLKDKSSKRFRVFLFSGEAGYKRYLEKIAGKINMHTAGLYTGLLKQLLIWNLPNRDAMMRTVRHEGFHQFLDAMLDDAPVWLNEGTAEYYETSRRKRGTFDGGQIRPLHLAMLRKRSRSMKSARDLIWITRAEYYSDPGLHYAQAWAMVHFLRKSTPKNRKLWVALFANLGKPGSMRSALEASFAGVDLEALDHEYKAYIRALR